MDVMLTNKMFYFWLMQAFTRVQCSQLPTTPKVTVKIWEQFFGIQTASGYDTVHAKIIYNQVIIKCSNVRSRLQSLINRSETEKYIVCYFCWKTENRFVDSISSLMNVFFRERINLH